MTVGINQAGWNVAITDEEYIKRIRNGTQKKPDFVFLFDTTGYAAEPFTKAGYHTLIVDMSNNGKHAFNKRATTVADWDILEFEDFLVELCSEARFVFGFPPCDDLAVTGAKHFWKKAQLNGNFQHDAIYLFRSVERIGERAKVPYSAENPTSRVSTLYRKPNFSFQPHEYGGYLPEDDEHPDYPQYIEGRDRYPKTTNLWQGNGFKNPQKLAVYCPPGYAKQYLKLGGKSEKTKRIRSSSPRGYFIALAQIYT
jgi:hypothetical protein